MLFIDHAFSIMTINVKFDEIWKAETQRKEDVFSILAAFRPRSLAEAFCSQQPLSRNASPRYRKFYMKISQLVKWSSEIRC